MDTSMRVTSSPRPVRGDEMQRAIRHALIWAAYLKPRFDDAVMIKHRDKLSGNLTQVCYEESPEDQKTEQK